MKQGFFSNFRGIYEIIVKTATCFYVYQLSCLKIQLKSSCKRYESLEKVLEKNNLRDTSHL